MNLSSTARKICNVIRDGGGIAYIVGGTVRDHILGVPSNDIDIEVYGLLVNDIIDDLMLAGFSLDIVGKSFGVIKIKGEDIDITIPRRDSKMGDGHRDFDVNCDPNMTLREAAMRRDFTINSISYNPYQNCLIDPFGGVLDLKNRILRHTSERFVDDPLRVLRGMQFVARYDLEVDPMTIKLCQTLSQDHLSKERVFEEWVKLITKGVKISKGLKFLVDTKWIKYYPELESLIDLPQDSEWHPEGDVFTHTCLCMDVFAGSKTKSDLEEQITCGFAVLCHDFGKATTTDFIRGRWRSLRHEQEGEQPTRSFLSRMVKADNQIHPSKLIENVVSLVTNHMAPTMYYEQKVSNGAIRRLSNRVERLDWLVWISTCDKLGRGSMVYQMDAENWLLEKAKELEVLDSKPKPIILGRHLIQLGMTPGLNFGSILNSAYEAQLDGIFSDVENGIEWVKLNYVMKGKTYIDTPNSTE